MDPQIDHYLTSLKTISPGLGDPELAQLRPYLLVRTLKKKELFLQAGQIQNALGFIVSGLVRSYYVDQEGNEITVGFYTEEDYATHYPSFIAQQPSRYSIQCIEESTFVCLSFHDLQFIYRTFPKFEQYGRLIAEEVLKRQQSRIESFIFQTAEERYIAFMKEQKNLFTRISVSHLCSFLGIERQSLTRIRQKLAHK